MTAQPEVNSPAGGGPSKGIKEMSEMWAAAEKAFESICHESLQKGEVKGFDDVQRMIEAAPIASYGIDAEQKDKWEKARSVGFESLKYLKLLVGAASLATSAIPIPGSVANITSNALCFVFNIPIAIKGYNDAIGEVFGEVSSALSQFHIYTSMENVDPKLATKIHQVMISFVKLCAHVVKYRQGSRRNRLLHQVRSIFDDDSGLRDEMAEFKRVQKQQRIVEGTLTLAVVVESQRDIARLLESFISFSKGYEEMHQTAQETQKGVQSLNADATRIKTLIKIRDSLDVPQKVRLDTNTTQTCTNIYKKWHKGTGLWIWEHPAYTTWTTPNKDKNASSHILLVSGPQSSGKTTASALITKRLEEQKGRTYVAHYFFPASIKKSDDENSPVQSALKYMAFQVARVDSTVRKELGKACDAGPGAFRRSASLESLDTLWEELKIGALGSGAMYYLVFDGLENLRDEQAEDLLKFVFGPMIAGDSSRRVCVLLSGTPELFDTKTSVAESRSALRINIEEYNWLDMRIMIDNALTNEGVLQHAEPESDQQRARDKIIEKLPQNVRGSYSLLQFGLSDVIRLLSTRTAVEDLDHMLEHSMSSHEAAIKKLQRSLTVGEIRELNELLKWVLFSRETLTLDQLEAAMFLYSNKKSLASLKYIITNKYSAILKLEDGYVYGQDGVQKYLEKGKDASGKSVDSSTISMAITINNVDQELCAHFLWDLAHKAIREKFNFDAASALHSSSQAAIAVDEFDAHHTIVNRAFEYLEKGHKKQTEDIGRYLVFWLPYHLNQLRCLEFDDMGTLKSTDKLEIGQSLYRLFKDDQVIRRHRVNFEPVWWEVEEMENVQKWLTDPAVVKRLDKKWLDEVHAAARPSRGFLKELVKIVVEGFLREREWNVASAYYWIEQFMGLDHKRLQQTRTPPISSAASSSSSTRSSHVSTTNYIDWDSISDWCQSFLGLPDAELNSLWYERLAEAAATLYSKANTVLSFYRRAIEKENPSWLCHRGLGITHFGQDQIKTAIMDMGLALKEAKEEDAMPKPAAKEFAELNLFLGHYNYEAGLFWDAATHYSAVPKSGDPAQVKEGQLGYLKAVLRFEDAKGMRELLKTTLDTEDGKERMTSILKMVARDADHDFLISKIFTVAKGHPDLLEGVVRAMEKATEIPRIAGMSEDDRFAEEEVCGVLLCDQGFATYTYIESLSGTDAVSAALRLWRKSRDLLSQLGGRNALIAQQHATTALAQHYFQRMVEEDHLGHIDALVELAEATSDIYHYSDAVGFLGALYALHDEKGHARKVLMPRIRLAFQILSDDILENDDHGFWAIYNALNQYQDFKNSVVALSLLGQPDLVTEALYFETKDIVGNDGMNKERVLELVTNLAKEAIQTAKTEFPDASQQTQRIKAAREYVDKLAVAVQTVPMPEANGGHNEAGGSELQSEQGEQTVRDLETALAHDLLYEKISYLQLLHTPEINTECFTITCDGRTIDGKHCNTAADFNHEFYHCIYCSNRGFCQECLKRLRFPDSGADIMVCSAKHRWLVMPPQGTDMYVGPRAKSVRVPQEVRAVKDDKSLLEICYGENSDSEEITVEVWEDTLAGDWGISLQEIREEISSQATPGEDEQEDRQEDKQEGKQEGKQEDKQEDKQEGKQEVEQDDEQEGKQEDKLEDEQEVKQEYEQEDKQEVGEMSRQAASSKDGLGE
ncbi:hypothetical protein V496_01166 [Pseudogymnoascus sp. VKM F-4515 (FW-2607)]|nr:hypothetical protein V496_01166 [Pseudogymnoascus sp. VKM F-4515 (FW-2607)]KFY96208.1 hypothetical protein V498_02814 [Pseudogymnoascus sp. VKM F-4517 (FW-2822)]